MGPILIFAFVGLTKIGQGVGTAPKTRSSWEQTYSPEQDIAFIDSVLPFFRDRRYLRVNGAPVLVVYRPQHMPDAEKTAARWRKHCRVKGFGEIYLVAALTQGNEDFERFGFDAGVEFPPHNAGNGVSLRNLAGELEPVVPLHGAIWDYSEFAHSYSSRDYSKRRIYRTAVPSWDNTARINDRAHILHDANPKNYEQWLDTISGLTIADRRPAERLVFINAWNEWAEGCHLEPDREHGRAFLEATARVKARRTAVNGTWSIARTLSPSGTPQSTVPSPSEQYPFQGEGEEEVIQYQERLHVLEEEIVRLRSIEESTIWRATSPIRRMFAGLSSTEVKQMRQIENENHFLRRTVADLMLERAAFRENAAKASDR